MTQFPVPVWKRIGYSGEWNRHASLTIEKTIQSRQHCDNETMNEFSASGGASGPHQFLTSREIVAMAAEEHTLLSLLQLEMAHRHRAWPPSEVIH